jgi:hypothetical protein
MKTPTSVSTENPGSRSGGGNAGDRRNTLRGRATVATQTEPSGVLTGVLGELAFYYGACCLHHSTPHRENKRR